MRRAYRNTTYFIAKMFVRTLVKSALSIRKTSMYYDDDDDADGLRIR